MRRRLFDKNYNWGILTYNVTDTSSATQLLYDYWTSRIEKMMVDDKLITPSPTYQFSTAGEHIVKIALKDSCTSLLRMCYECTSLISADLTNWDVSNMTDISYLFYGCTSLENADLSGWDVSKVTAAYRLFGNCTSLEYIDISNFQFESMVWTAYSYGVSGMFRGCTNLKSANLSNCNFGGGSVYGLFWETPNLESVNFDGCGGSFYYPANMFSESGIKTVDFSKCPSLSFTNSMTYMFAYTPNLTTVNFYNVSLTTVNNVTALFLENTTLTSLKILGKINSGISYVGTYIPDTNGTFYYNSDNDYSPIINQLPDTWTTAPL